MVIQTYPAGLRASSVFRYTRADTALNEQLIQHFFRVGPGLGTPPLCCGDHVVSLVLIDREDLKLSLFGCSYAEHDAFTNLWCRQIIAISSH